MTRMAQPILGTHLYDTPRDGINGRGNDYVAKVMVVDDAAFMRLRASKVLQDSGHEVLQAENGADAVRQYAQHHPDAVLMDINLGEGPDGIDIAKKFKKKKDVPVIYLTGFADSRTLEKARGTFPAAFVTKPISETNLRIQLELALYKEAAKKIK